MQSKLKPFSNLRVRDRPVSLFWDQYRYLKPDLKGLYLKGKYGGGATRPLPRDGGVEKLHRDPTVGSRPKSRSEVKNGRSGAEDDAPEARMRDSQGGSESDPAKGVLPPQCGVLNQRLAASTWWCDARPSIREVSQNGETTTPRGPAIWSSPIVWKVKYRWADISVGLYYVWMQVVQQATMFGCCILQNVKFTVCYNLSGKKANKFITFLFIPVRLKASSNSARHKFKLANDEF